MKNNREQLLEKICTSINDGDVKSFKELLAECPDIANMNVYEGTVISQTLLHYAASESRMEMCAYLVDNGISTNAIDYSYMTPLDCSANKGDFELVEWFVSKGACVDGDVRGFITPLISAAREGHYKIVEYLIQHGADINRLHTRSNSTALDIATAFGQGKVVEILTSYGALKAHEEFDLTIERASGVLWDIHHEAGWILSSKFCMNSIDIRLALINEDKKNKILFTIGSHQQIPRRELMLSVPLEWPINKQLMEENSIASFPIQFLFTLAEYRLTGGELDEGCVFGKQDTKWSHLMWPEKIDGFIAVDYQFGSEADPGEYGEETVKLLLLVPIKYPKTGCPQGKKLEEWIEKRRTAKWAANALKYDHINDEKRL